MFYWLLLPFTWLYTAITYLRNYLYDIELKKSVQFDLPVISIGNLTVGGTGKTPHVAYIIDLLLNHHYKVATLSRGYGRKTKGFLLAQPKSNAQTIGDESYQLWQHFKQKIVVAVGEERAMAIPLILAKNPDIQVITLDDAFQHRAVRPSLQILLTDYNRLFYEDVPFPVGRLRESKSGAKRADVIIVSKCPDALNTAVKEQIKSKIMLYATPQTPIFFTSIQYDAPQPFEVSLQNNHLPFDTKETNIILFSGIAQPAPLEKYIAEKFTLKKHFIFPDHHNYQPQDLKKITTYFEENSTPNTILLTTEKDFARLSSPTFEPITKCLPLYYLPIKIYFLENKEKFDEIILKKCIFVET